MKLFRLMLLAVLLSSCSLISPQKIVITLPERPELAACPEKPVVTGDVVNGEVKILLADAVKLSTWMRDYQICAERNAAKLSGHIEKLENRIKALAEVK